MELKQNEKVKRIVEILKKRFPNLTAIELVNMAYAILEAIEEHE